MLIDGLSDLADWATESSTIPSNSPTSTVSPSFLLTSFICPETGETTSKLTLSVSSSIITSPSSTMSPLFFIQVATVASIVDSARSGTIISCNIIDHSINYFNMQSIILFCWILCTDAEPDAVAALGSLPTYFSEIDLGNIFSSLSFINFQAPLF